MKDTFTDDSVVTEMKDFLVVHIDVESEAGQPVAKRFSVGPLPTLLFLNPDGSVRDAILGYRKPADFKKEVQRIREDKGTIGDMKRQADAEPKNVAKRIAYARKLKDVGDTKGFEAQVAEVLKLDPERKAEGTSELAFDALMAQVEALWGDGKTSEIPALMSAALEKEKDPEILFRGWATLASIHEELGRSASKEDDDDTAETHAKAAFQAKKKAWATVPEKIVLPFGNELAWTLWEQRAGISAEDKAFALEVARKMQPLAEAAGNHGALDTVACVYFMNGKKDEALALVRKCIELDPKNGDYTSRLKEFGG